MVLSLILLLGIFLHIIIPSIFFPLFFLGTLIVYILDRQYWALLIWNIIIVLILQVSSLTPWWQFALYYFLWSTFVYIGSITLDKSWPVQSIMATIFLSFSHLILNKFNIDYINWGIYTSVNGIGIGIVLYMAEKLKVYEKSI